jgi:1,6-anhydro-N-acetylmuramate kinase
MPHSIREAERHLTQTHAEAVAALLAKAGWRRARWR